MTTAHRASYGMRDGNRQALKRTGRRWAVLAASCWLFSCSGGNDGGDAVASGRPAGRATGNGGASSSDGVSSSSGATAPPFAGGGPASPGAGGATGGPSSSGGNASPTGATGGTASGVTNGASGATNGASGATGGASDTTSVPVYSLRVDTPQSGMTVRGMVTVTGRAPGFLNVEVWDATHQKPPLAQTKPKPDGTFSTSVDSTRLPSGPTTWTVWAWDAPPNGSSMHDASVDLSLIINQASGSGGAGNGGSPGDGGSTGSPGSGGRNFLIGMFDSGSEITSYKAYLGYDPEVTYDSSYQDDHHKQCGQPISGLNDINGYPVIVSVFTYDADYAGTAQGAHDGCYEQLFTGLESKASTIYGVRIDVEFYPHPAATDFKGSFDRIVSIAKKHLPARIKYIFNPNWDAGLGADYVPGSADVVGPDAYNNPQWCQGKSSAQCAGDKFDPNHPGSIAYWTKIAQQLGKPMALPEWGDDYGDGVYIQAVADWAYDKALVTPGKSNGVVYLGYWDSNLNEDGHLRGDAKTAFHDRFANIPYSGGSFWGPPIPPTTFGAF